MGDAAIDEVEIPQYKDGVQTALVKAKVMRRVGPMHFTMEMLEIHLYEKGERVMTLTTPRARYNAERGVLASREPCVITSAKHGIHYIIHITSNLILVFRTFATSGKRSRY